MQTAPASLRPWGLLGYICGFQGHEDLWKELENAWIVGKEDVLNNKGSLIYMEPMKCSSTADMTRIGTPCPAGVVHRGEEAH